MIDFSKPVKTRDGRAVRILCTDAPGGWPVVGIVELFSHPHRWACDGRSYHNVGLSPFDLIQAEEPVVRWGVVDRNTGRFCQIAEPKLHGLYNGELFKLTFDGDKVTGELVK